MNQWFPETEDERMRCITKELEGAFWSDENIFASFLWWYFYYLYVLVKTHRTERKRVNFIVCHLHCNKPDSKKMKKKVKYTIISPKHFEFQDTRILVLTSG